MLLQVAAVEVRKNRSVSAEYSSEYSRSNVVAKQFQQGFSIKGTGVSLTRTVVSAFSLVFRSAVIADETCPLVAHFVRSLTTPPCSEGVNWHVAEDSLTASGRQLRALERMMGNNARPVLPVHNRLVIAPE